MTAEREGETFKRALTEYRVRNWDPSEFTDLPADIQRRIRTRASQLQEAEDRLQASAKTVTSHSGPNCQASTEPHSR